MSKRYGFAVDGESVRVVRDAVGSGSIFEFRPKDAEMVAGHLGSHPNTIFIAGSGVNYRERTGPFSAGEPLLALEWVRFEPNPKKGEPECNAYRFLFGQASDGSYRGIQVTQSKGGPLWQQVADHWMDYDTAAQRFRSMEPI